MKTKRFAPKDAKLLREHPDKTLDELLELGLSNKAYQRLQAQKEEVLQPVKVEQVQAAHAEIVQMSNMRTGRVVQIGYKAAKMLSTKYPKEFKILN